MSINGLVFIVCTLFQSFCIENATVGGTYKKINLRWGIIAKVGAKYLMWDL